MKLINLFILIFLFSGISALAQMYKKTDERKIDDAWRYYTGKKFKTWSVEVGGGPNFYFTDIKSYNVVPASNWQFATSLALSKQFTPAFSVEFRNLWSTLYSNNEKYYFEGDTWEYTLSTKFIINQLLSDPGPLLDRYNLYLSIGAGFCAFRTSLHSMDDGRVLRWNEVSSYDNSDYVVLGYNPQNPEEKIKRQKEVVLPMGVGCYYRVNDWFDLNLATNFRFLAEDNLDFMLMGTTNDGYWHTSLSCVFNFGQKKMRHSRWSYRGQGFTIFRPMPSDPLPGEVAEIEKEIDKLKNKKVIVNDSVIVHNQTKEIITNSDNKMLFFEKNVVTLEEDEMVLIAEAAILLKRNPDWGVVINGYSDDKSTESGCKEVANKRMIAVSSYFIDELKIDASQITMGQVYWGKLLREIPVTQKGDFDSSNKRVEIVFQKK